jgi:hypothetical protein
LPPTIARQGARVITATTQIRRPPAGILAYPLAGTITVGPSNCSYLAGEDSSRP